VEHSTDISRLKQDATTAIVSQGVHSILNADVLAITNATLLTYDTGNINTDLIHNGVLITRAGVIDSVGSFGEVIVPDGATVIDAQGG
jgi:imidazolonepropionase-like amidohydrolase